MSDVEWENVGTPNYWGRTFSVPKDANPNGRKRPITINPCDKFERGVGLSGRESSDFSGVCEYGENQLVPCYRFHDDYYTIYDFLHLCSQCPHFVGGRNKHLFDTYRAATSMFDGNEVYRHYEDYIRFDKPGSFVYFISDGEYIKIGKAKQPKQRLMELQTGNPKELKILWLIPCKNDKAAYYVEQSLHGLYRSYRQCGEWFDVLPKMQKHSFDSWFGESQIDSKLQEAI